MLSSVQKRGIVQENDGRKDVHGKKADDGEQDAKSLRAHFHGAQWDPVGSPTRLISHCSGPKGVNRHFQNKFFFIFLLLVRLSSTNKYINALAYEAIVTKRQDNEDMYW